MSKDTGGPAFPHQDSGDTGLRPGMSLRDYFAAAALPSVIRSCVPQECIEGENMAAMFARRAYESADAMLIERAKGDGT